jgi:hypothetical protein
MSELPEAPYIGIVEALTWLAFGEAQTPKAMQDDALAGLEKWGGTQSPKNLYAAFEKRLAGKDAGDFGKLADRLVKKMNRPLGELANELHADMIVGERKMAALADAERQLFEAALSQQVTLDGQPYPPTNSPDPGVPFEPIPPRHFHLPVAINLFHGSLSIAHGAPMETYAKWKGPDYANVRLPRVDVLKVAALRAEKHAKKINRSFDAAHWNQYQALAWVHARSRELVAKFASDAERGAFWIEAKLPSGEPRLVEESAPPPTLLEITLRTADIPHADGRQFPESKRELLQALADGKVAATGLRNNMGDRTAIPAADWIDSDFYDNPAVVGPSDFFRPSATKWHDVRFARVDILQVWPDTASPTDSSGHTAAAEVRTHAKLSQAQLDRAVLAYKAALPRGAAVTEKGLRAALDQSLGQHVPRDLVRAIRREHFGEAPMGRPKKSRGR